MSLQGNNYIGATQTGKGSHIFKGVDPMRSAELEPPFHEATPEEIDAACTRAAEAFDDYRRTTPQQRAAFLRAIAAEIEATGDELIERAVAESALPAARITGERA